MFSIHSLIQGWNNFFYARTDASNLGVFRILIGFFLLLNGVSLIQDFEYWFGVGNESFVPLQESFNLYSGFRINIYKWLSPTTNSAWFVLITYILSAIGIMVGFKTRISTVVCFILLVSMQNRNFAILNSGDTVMRCILFLMMFAPTHVKYSVDSYIRSKAGVPYPSDVSLLTIRLLQLQFALVYFATVLFKLKGYDWVEGTAVYYSSRLVNFQRLLVPVVFDFPWLIKFSTWFALIVEFAMGALIWVKEWRRVVLLLGVVLHIGIELTMDIGFFEWVMISCYLLYVEPGEIKLAQNWIRDLFQRKLRKA